jgi:hypothetical protein
MTRYAKALSAPSRVANAVEIAADPFLAGTEGHRADHGAAAGLPSNKRPQPEPGLSRLG